MAEGGPGPGGTIELPIPTPRPGSPITPSPFGGEGRGGGIGGGEGGGNGNGNGNGDGDGDGDVEPHAARLAKRLRKHRAELTRFLWDRELDGTNNAAERALRPAVVMRKITGGSRSKAGAEAWAKLASLMRTAGQQGRDVLETVKQLLVEHWAGKLATALLTSGP